MTVIILWFFLTVPWVGLQYVIVVSPDYTQLLFSGTETNHDFEILSCVQLICKNNYPMNQIEESTSIQREIKLEFILKLKIKHNDWLLGDTCPQAANHCALF